MISSNSEYKVLFWSQVSYKAKQLFILLKFRLSALVVFSGAFGYLLASKGSINWLDFGMFILGSFMVTGAANIINQVKERDLDKLMKRTKDRPLPMGRLSVNEAIAFTLVLAMAGSALLVFFVNPLVAGLSLLSLLLYGFVYTPLKQKSPISVLVGAFPGALPPMIGWVAMAGGFTVEAFVLFGIQFVWQFPHFWSIAWIGHEDYTKAGFKMLPSKKGPDVYTSLQISFYTLFLIPLGLLPTQYGITGTVSGIVAFVCGILFLLQTLELIKTGSNKSAKKIMFSSFLYLPIVQIAYLLDKM
ncbi:heme o synthase [Flammeovirgaceae bacterium SG7u.111]|nr:heme o synthase [Flammeovirgaceae bacterium SG7u.132]WPO33797.1 heme o synthase [Flammeovirgaceae bacterium SG7u.111]